MVREVEILHPTLSSICPEQLRLPILRILLVLIPRTPPLGLGREVAVVVQAGLLAHPLHDVVVDAVVLADGDAAHEVLLHKLLDPGVGLEEQVLQAPEHAAKGQEDGRVQAGVEAEQAVHEEQDLQQRGGAAGRGEDGVHKGGRGAVVDGGAAGHGEVVHVVGAHVAVGGWFATGEEAQLGERVHHGCHDVLGGRSDKMRELGNLGGGGEGREERRWKDGRIGFIVKGE